MSRRTGHLKATVTRRSGGAVVAGLPSAAKAAHRAAVRAAQTTTAGRRASSTRKGRR